MISDQRNRVTSQTLSKWWRWPENINLLIVKLYLQWNCLTSQAGSVIILPSAWPGYQHCGVSTACRWSATTSALTCVTVAAAQPLTPATRRSTSGAPASAASERHAAVTRGEGKSWNVMMSAPRHRRRRRRYAHCVWFLNWRMLTWSVRNLVALVIVKDHFWHPISWEPGALTKT